MMSVTTVFQGRLSQDTSVRLVQNAWQYSPQGRWGGSATLDLGGRHSSADAVSAIMQIILDAKGNASVSIDAPQATASVGTGDGDDVIDINAREVRVHSGNGNDTIAVDAHLVRMNAGDGNDNIDVTIGRHAGTGVSYILAGDGDDVVNADVGGGGPLFIEGGAGDDTVSLVAHSAASIRGGRGDDTIDVVSEGAALFISGGDGDDKISIDAERIYHVTGGRGDDTIALNNRSGGLSTIMLAEGDGNDVVETNGPLAIFRSSADGTHGLNDATITKLEDGVFEIVFADSNDTLIVKLTGDMAKADDILLDQDPVDGMMTIRSASLAITQVATVTRSDFQTSTNRE
ncbi:hypothetical protein [Mesorhizobium sp. CAU 1741]|uniref:hypothetical protein n=1 Tax=Mesorhizobium sp. CAU 1741 TaxID=3140366 RepID=UPI00325C30AD